MRSGELLAARGTPRGAKVVERDGARDLAEPCPRRAACRVEAVPQTERTLERDAGQLLCGITVGREPREVAVDVVEVGLRGLLERHLTCCTPPGGDPSRPWTPVVSGA